MDRRWWLKFAAGVMIALAAAGGAGYAPTPPASGCSQTVQVS